ncbi:hypothetical protein HQQ94_05535 [Shewanella sp. VB17]|uniref:hypothetical protein n=1 Tax=Shewanella sp. VB17 TaxID=2739432 RepID=UPI0015640E91|nr:hypothetical protein [Shewanella sp. VB17]NRD72719.1 hypothetical protein [Shewanella sp. VB17]
MYIERFKKSGKVYCGFFSDLNEYPTKEDVPLYLKNGELTEADLEIAEKAQQPI